MDRGRAGGYVGNNFVQIQLNKKKRQEHLDRIKKIKTRKPGSSATLDNNPPVVIEAMLNDPRKSALRHHFNFVTERENKVLLKRISAILTAPPKITDKEYQEMKRLVIPNTKGFRKVYEQNVTIQKNKEFFVHLKKLQPYYKAEEWERDYQKQLFNQKFMRQVKYTRPPDFVDPLAPPPETADATAAGKRAGGSSTSLTAERGSSVPGDSSSFGEKAGQRGFKVSSSSASHIGRVRAVRDEHSKGGGGTGGRSRVIKNLNQSQGSAGENDELRRAEKKRSPNKQRGGAKDGGSDQHYSEDEEEQDYGFDFDEDEGEGGASSFKVNVFVGGEGAEHDSFYRDGAGDGRLEDGGSGELVMDENRVQLAFVHRCIRITDDNSSLAFQGSFSQSQQPGSSLTGGGSSSSNQYQDVLLHGAQQQADADVQCWLINQEYVVISAVTLDKGRLLDAEAEISVLDLSIIRGLGADQSLLDDMPALEAIAREMVENVELRVDCGVSRLVLNLVSDGDEEEDDADYPLSDAEGNGSSNSLLQSSLPGTLVSGPGAGQGAAPVQGSLVSEEEIENMLLGDRSQTVLLKGVLLPVCFNVNANAQSIGSITALIELAKRAKRIEHVYALLRFVSTSDDQMAVTAQFVSSTTFMFKRGSRHRPAVHEGSSVRATTSLPSVIQADPEMLLTFAENLSANLKVEHDCKSGENELIIVT